MSSTSSVATSKPSGAWLIALFLCLLCLAAIAYACATHVRPSMIVAMIALAFVPYSLCLYLAPKQRIDHSIRWGVLLAIAGGAPMLLSPPVLCDDVHRFRWEANVIAAHQNPYVASPRDPSLIELRDETWSKINHSELTTAYPPLAQLFFTIGRWLGNTMLSFQVLALLLHVLTVVLVGTVARRPTFAAVGLALNPLALIESAQSGHIDSAVGFFLCAAAYFLAKSRFVRASLAMLAATATKLVGIALLPLLWRNKKALSLGVVLCLCAVAPLAMGDGSRNGFVQYGLRWQGNDSFYGVIESAVSTGLEVAIPSRDGYLLLRGARPLIELAGQLGLDPWITNDNKSVADIERVRTELIARPIARALCLAAVLSLALFLVRRKTDPFFAARSVVLATLLLSPQVHPWYLLWLLPLEFCVGGLAGLVWSATVLVAYVPLEGWLSTRIWVEEPNLRIFEYVLVLAALTIEVSWLDRRRSDRYLEHIS